MQLTRRQQEAQIFAVGGEGYLEHSEHRLDDLAGLGSQQGQYCGEEGRNGACAPGTPTLLAASSHGASQLPPAMLHGSERS